MRRENALGLLTFTGFAISIVALLGFTFEFIPEMSDWGRLGTFVLLALFYVFMAIYIESTIIGKPFFEGPRLRWLRPAVVLYLLAAGNAIAAEVVFLGIEEVARPVKYLVSLAAGVALVLVAARSFRKPDDAASGAADEAMGPPRH